jgi:hypothetical protein
MAFSTRVVFVEKKMDRCFWLPDDDSAGPNTRHKAWLLSLFRGSEDDETIHEQGNAKGRLEYPLLFYRAFDYGAVFYARRHIPSYAKNFAGLQPPYFLLMWEEDFKRLSAQNHFQVLDISEGRGPAARHRLVLLEPQEDSPIIDPQGYEVQADQ